MEGAHPGFVHIRNTLPWVGLFILSQTIQSGQNNYSKKPEHSIDVIPEYEQEVDDYDSQTSDLYRSEDPPFLSRNPALIAEVIAAMHALIGRLFELTDEGDGQLNAVGQSIVSSCIDDETGEFDAHEAAELARQFEEAHDNKTGLFSWMHDEDESDPGIN